LMYDANGRRCKSKLCDVETTKGCWVNCRFKTEAERAKEKADDKENLNDIPIKVNIDTEELKKQIEELKRLLAEKDNEIKQLKEQEICFDEIPIDDISEPEIEWQEVYDIDNLEHMDYEWKCDEPEDNVSIKEIRQGMEQLINENYLEQKTGYKLKEPERLLKINESARDYDETDLGAFLANF